MAMDKKASRIRRSRQTRLKIIELGMSRLAVHRTNQHIYANIVSGDGTKVLVSASTLEGEVKKELGDNGRNSAGRGGNISAASLVGKRATYVTVNELQMTFFLTSCAVFGKDQYDLDTGFRKLALSDAACVITFV